MVSIEHQYAATRWRRALDGAATRDKWWPWINAYIYGRVKVDIVDIEDEIALYRPTASPLVALSKGKTMRRAAAGAWDWVTK